MIDERLTRARRLGRNTDIRRVLKRGQRISNQYSTLFVLPDRAQYTHRRGGDFQNRFAVILKRGVARSNVERNRLKRCAKETYRKAQAQLKGCAQDRVLIIRNQAIFERSAQERTNDFLRLLLK